MIPSFVKRLSSSLSFGRKELDRKDSKKEDGATKNKRNNRDAEADNNEITALRRQPTHELETEEAGSSYRKSSRTIAVESVRQATKQLSTRSSSKMSAVVSTSKINSHISYSPKGFIERMNSTISSVARVSRSNTTTLKDTVSVRSAKTPSLSKQSSAISNGHKVVNRASVINTRKSLSTNSVRKSLSKSSSTHSRRDSSVKATTKKLKKKGGKELWFPRGALLAVKANDNCGFYLCRSLRSIYNYTKEVPVKWLIEKKKSKLNEYVIGYRDSIETYSILLQVTLIQLSQSRYALPDDELAEIQKLLRLSEDVERGDLSLDKLTDDVEPIILIDEPAPKKLRLVKTESQKLRDKAARLEKKQEKSEKGGEKRKRAVKPKGEKEPKKRKISKKKLELELHPRPDIQVLEKDPLFETRTPMPYISKVANSRLIFRAINLQDNELLTQLLEDGNNIFQLYEKSVDSSDQPLLEAFKTKNKDIILTILQEYFGDKFKNRLINNAEEQSMLEKLNTGSYNEISLGVQFIRKISASRGCREGNNAFLKNETCLDYRDSLVEIFKSSLKLDADQQNILEQFCKENDIDLHSDYYFNQAIPQLLLLGRNELVGKIIQLKLTGFRSMFNSLYADVLLFTTEELKHCGPAAVRHVAKRMNKGGNTEQADSYGKIPLIYAIEADRPENVLLLLEDYKKRANEGAILSEGVNRRIKNSSTPLHIAVEKKLYEVTKILLEFGANVNAKLNVSFNQETPLMIAAASGDLQIVRLLMQYNPEVEQKDRMGRTAVIHACMNGATNVLSYLLNIGASGERVDNSGNTPLHYAAAYGWYFTVKLLLDSGVDSNSANMWKTTPVGVAYLKGHVGIVHELLNNGKADINFPDDNGRTMIFHACSQSQEQSDLFEQIKYMVEEKGAICTLKDDKDHTLLHCLALNTTKSAVTVEQKNKIFQQTVAIAELILKNGCELNAVDKNGDTAVMMAIRLVVNLPLIEFLLKAGCKILPPSGEEPRNTLLHSLADHMWDNPDNLSKITDLFKKHKYLDVIKSMAKDFNNCGQTPLHLAITKFESWEPYQNVSKLPAQNFVKYIIQDLKVDVNVKVAASPEDEPNRYTNNYLTVGKTAIHLALSDLEAELVSDLVKFGADLNMYDVTGMTPLGLCISNNFIDLIDILFKSSKCNFNLPVALYAVDNKVNPLIFAAERQKGADMIIKLIDCGCDINAVRPVTLMTCLHIMISSRNSNQRGDILKVVEKLNSKKYDFNQVDSCKKTTLHYAVRGNTGSLDESHELEVKLIQLGANVGLTDDTDKTALHYVFEKATRLASDPAELTKLICRSLTKDQWDIQDVHGRTALHYAAAHGAVTCCMYLSMIGADVNIKDYAGNTALALAVLNSKDGCATTLIQSGTNLKYLVAKNISKPAPTVITSSPTEDSSSSDSSDSESPSVAKKVIKTKTEDVPTEDWKWQITTLLKKQKVELDVPLYQAVIEKNLTGAAMFVVDAGYDKSGLTEFDAISMALKCCKYNIALRLLCTTTDLKLFCQLEDNQRNLLHILGLSFENFTGQIQNDVLFKIADILINVGVSPIDFDSSRCTPLMYTLINRQYEFANYMAAKSGGYNLNYKDEFKRSYLAAALWRCHSSKICAATQNFILGLRPSLNLNSEIYLPVNPQLVNLEMAGKSDPEIWQSYPDDKTTVLIIAITVGDFKASYNFLNQGANPNFPDGNKITPLMHAVSQNKVNHVKQLLNYTYDPTKEAQLKATNARTSQVTWNRFVQPFMFQLNHNTASNNSLNLQVNNADNKVNNETEKKKDDIEEEFLSVQKTSLVNLNAKDSNGRTALHYAAKSTQLGTFDNAEIAFVLVKAGADLIKDSSGLDPYELAVESGAVNVAQVLKKHFKLTGRKKKSHVKPDFLVDDRVSASLMDLPDYKTIAEKFLKSFDSDMELEDTYIHEVDRNCNVVNGQLVMDEEQSIYYDALMTKVDVSRGEFGLYNFYQMQLVHQPSKNLYVMFTRWGRIQDQGQFQHTPFTDKDEAVTQFIKLFKEKSANLWTDIKNFQRKHNKYRLVEDIARKAPPPQKDIVFKLKSRCKSVLPKHLFQIIRNLMDPKAIQLSMSRTAGLDVQSLPFGQLNRERLLLGKQLLDQLEKLVDETEAYAIKSKTVTQEQNEIDAYQKNLEMIEELSNEFFHVIPQSNFVYEAIKPLYKRKNLDIHIRNLSNLLDYEIACKMLLAAMHERTKFNPVDFIYRCLDCKMEFMNENDAMSQMILEYIWKGCNYEKSRIYGIYKLARKGESERLLATGIENRLLLWHGSSKTNLLSILSRGLLVAPPEVKVTGSAYGKGIYFSDVFQFSNRYIDSTQTKIMLLCEVALGNVHNVRQNRNTEKPSWCNSVVARSNENAKTSSFILPSGAGFPQHLELYQATQYVVSDPAQVCLRYLVHYF